MSDKIIKLAITEIGKGNIWKKFANPTVPRGKTTHPKTSADQERLGIRFDYDRVITGDDGTEYHLFKMQANAGKIPASIKAWRDKNGTDAVMAKVKVKKGATVEEVIQSLDDARQEFKDSKA